MLTEEKIKALREIAKQKDDQGHCATIVLCAHTLSDLLGIIDGSKRPSKVEAFSELLSEPTLKIEGWTIPQIHKARVYWMEHHLEAPTID